MIKALFDLLHHFANGTVIGHINGHGQRLDTIGLSKFRTNDIHLLPGTGIHRGFGNRRLPQVGDDDMAAAGGKLLSNGISDTGFFTGTGDNGCFPLQIFIHR